MNVAAVRDGIETRLDTMGIRVYTAVPEQVVVPCAIIELGDGQFISFDDTFSASNAVAYTLNMKVLILTGRAALKASQDKLDDYLSVDGNDSIRQAIIADPDLNSSANSCRVVGASNFGTYTYSAIEYLGVEFNLEIIG